jgi:RNA recognition motif-containing protein
MSEESLQKEMEKYGKVEKTSIPVKDGRARGFGFVEFSSLNEAKKALEDLNSAKKKLAGNKVIVDWCIPKNIFKRLETDSLKAEEKENEDDVYLNF